MIPTKSSGIRGCDLRRRLGRHRPDRRRDRPGFRPATTRTGEPLYLLIQTDTEIITAGPPERFSSSFVCSDAQAAIANGNGSATAPVQRLVW